MLNCNEWLMPLLTAKALNVTKATYKSELIITSMFSEYAESLSVIALSKARFLKEKKSHTAELSSNSVQIRVSIVTESTVLILSLASMFKKSDNLI